MKKIISGLILALIFSTVIVAQAGQTKEPQPLDMTPIDLGHCGMYLLRQEYAVFNDQESLNKAVKAMKEYCVSAVAPKIDFQQYTLIGAGATVGGCPAGSQMDVAVEQDEAKQVYRIKVTAYDNPCRGLSYRQQWFLVAKMPVGYKAELTGHKADSKRHK
jgi:hypothetical protein